MELVAHLIFWPSAFIVIYPYVIYPALMALIARLRPAPRPPEGELPSVSVIVAAYNEEQWIERKIETTLSQDYPANRLEMIVVSDGSTDWTADILSAIRDPRVKLLVQVEHRGKSEALNLGVREAKGEILVFTDANAFFTPGAIRRLTEHFTDPKVGLVSGQGLYGELGDRMARVVANGYVRLEALIKTGESALGFVGGADGAIYALRRTLYRDLLPTQVSDLFHTVGTPLAGYESRFDAAACTVEPPSQGGSQELHRHVRIIAQGFAIFAEFAPQLAAHRLWKELWILCSHRLLRWISAAGLLGLLSASLVGHGRLLFIALIAQGIFYSVAALGGLADRHGKRLGVIAAPYYFCVVSAAGLCGFIRFLCAGAQATWSPRGVNWQEEIARPITGAYLTRSTSKKP